MRLSEWMSQNGVNDDQMAEKCAVDRVTISRIRRDVNRPSWPLIAKITAITSGSVTADDFAAPPSLGAEPEALTRGNIEAASGS